MKEESNKVEVTEENVLVLDAGMIDLSDGITRCCWGMLGVFMS